MESVLLVMQIVALSAVTALCLYLITVLIRVRNILDTVQRDVKAISIRVIPVLDNLEIITDKVKIITEAIGDQVESMKQIPSRFTNRDPHRGKAGNHVVIRILGTGVVEVIMTWNLRHPSTNGIHRPPCRGCKKRAHG